jgi:hypothetical protein
LKIAPIELYLVSFAGTEAPKGFDLKALNKKELSTVTVTQK